MRSCRLGEGRLRYRNIFSKDVYVKNFKGDESSLEYLEKYAQEALPIEDLKDVGEVIFFDSKFFDDKLAVSILRILPEIEKSSEITGYPIFVPWSKDDIKTNEKYKNSIVAIYFRLPGKEPKFIKWPKIKF